MSRLLRCSTALARPVRCARRRPVTCAAVVLLGFVAAAGGVYGYACREWAAARADLAADRPQAARERLRFCRLVWPGRDEVRLLAARAARLADDPSAAEALLNEIIKDRGGATPAVQLEFLLLRVQTGELDEVANPLLEAAGNDHPESVVILETLARAYMHRHRYRTMYACLTRWIELQPGATKPYQWRGWALERMNQSERAAEDYHKALELDPGLARVRVRVAEMLLEEKQASEALSHLRVAERSLPGDPAVLSRIGVCNYLLGRPAEARPLLEAALPHLPTDPLVLVNLARLDLEEGRGAEAEARLRTAAAADKSDLESRYLIVTAYQIQGKAAESAAALAEHEQAKVVVDRLNKLLREQGDAPSGGAAIPAEIGELFLKLEHDHLGEYWLEQALTRDPGHQPAHKALAEYYARKGNEDRAARHRRRLRDAVRR